MGGIHGVLFPLTSRWGESDSKQSKLSRWGQYVVEVGSGDKCVFDGWGEVNAIPLTYFYSSSKQGDEWFKNCWDQKLLRAILPCSWEYLFFERF